MNYINIEKIPFQYSLQELPEGMKADCTGGVASNSVSTNQRRQLTVFTASAFSTIQPQTTLQTSGRGRKRSCPIKTELNVAVPGGTAGGVFTNVELQGLPPAAAALKQKIPRPPNAFMLFANDWRRKLASQFPKESNKDISIRLGGMWKNMEKDEKEKYFQYAREVDAAHKKKYPDYVYNPKEARMRKALREQSRGERQGAGSGGGGGGNSGGSSRAGGGPAPWAKHRQIMNHRQPIMVGEQTVHGHHHHNHQAQNRRPGDETAAAALCKLEAASAVGGGAAGAGGMLQNFNDYLSDLSSSYPAVVAQSGEFIVPDLDQSWYSSYLQGPVQNAAATYLMRAPPDGGKAVSAADEWGTHFAVPSSAASDNTADTDAFISHNVSVAGNGGFMGSAMTIGSRDRAQQPLLNGSASGHHTPTHGMTSPVGDKAVDIDGHANVDLKDSVVSDSKSLLELSRIKVENGIDGNGNKDGLRLPGFQQAFGSTEIGRFSQHEGFFEASIPQPEAQPEPKNIPNPVTPPRNKSSSDIDYENGGSYGILSPSSNMSPSVWAPLLYSPTSMKDGASFGSPAFTHQSPLTNFIDYSLLSGTEFMDIPSSHCSNGYSTSEEKDLQILLATDSNGTRNDNGRATDNETMFSDAIQPIRRIIDIDNDGSGISALRRKPQTTERTNEIDRHVNEILDVNSNNTKCNFHFKRIKSTDGFANQDLKMNCVNQPPVIISENEKICVILESSNVNLDACNATNPNNRNKRFTNL